MITLEPFKDNEFALQVITKEQALDYVGDKKFFIQIITVRLSPIALNAWILSSMLNSMDCYETVKEWEEYKARVAAKRKKFREQILKILGIKAEEKRVSINQSLSEFFTVIYIKDCGRNQAGYTKQ